MAIKTIQSLGNPILLQKSKAVKPDDKTIKQLESDLRDTARAFNQQHGWGRAISAVQIGVLKRVIYVDAPQELLLINPKVINTSEETIEIWDDCMSFPELLIKIKRYKNFSLQYFDREWQLQKLFVEGELSELLQHELDHLDGILATMQAVDNSQIILQSEKHFIKSGNFAN